MGADLEIAAALGHAINPTYAALTPLTATAAPFAHLSRRITHRHDRGSLRHARSERHRRISVHASGLQRTVGVDVSHVAVRSLADASQPARITVQWTPLRDSDWEDAFLVRARRAPCSRRSATRCPTVSLKCSWPRPASSRHVRLRLWPRRAAAVNRHTRARLAAVGLGDERYKKAEVTGGGVNLADVDPADTGEPHAQGIVSLRRDARCFRADRRLQLSLGVGHGTCRRPRRRTKAQLKLRPTVTAVLPTFRKGAADFGRAQQISVGLNRFRAGSRTFS